MAKKYFMVLDTETFSSDRKVFDLGFKIIDRAGMCYEQGSFVVEEILCNENTVWALINDEFSKNKVPHYFASLNSGKQEFICKPFVVIRAIVNSVLQQYHATLCAYNISFDINALNKTSRAFLNCDFFEEMPELLDIWHAAMSTLCGPSFIKFIAENSIVTDKGNPQTGAEAVYKFLTKNPQFEEAHTALADCEIESEIFAACVKTHKKMDKEPVKMCMHNAHWQDIVNRYHEYTQN